MNYHESACEVCVIPYSVPDNAEAHQEAMRTGNFIRAHFHGSRLPPYHPLGMQLLFSENGDVSWIDKGTEEGE